MNNNLSQKIVNAIAYQMKSKGITLSKMFDEIDLDKNANLSREEIKNFLTFNCNLALTK